MNKAQFLALPTHEQLGEIWDLLQSRPATTGTPAGAGNGSPPKYDTSISRKGGMVQYASETDLSGLIFWKNRADEPPSDPKYAESNAKQSKALSYWIGYRQANPNAVWMGERNRQQVTAAAPSAKPETYIKGAPTSAAYSGSTQTADNFDETDDIPF